MKTVYNYSLTRREALRTAGGALVGIAAARLGWSADADAANLPHLTDANPAAASLGYTEDSGSVNAHNFPTHKPEQRCVNCKYFQAGSGGVYSPCRLYPGYAVDVNGWCAGYVAKA
jgi:hypothetical protein